MVVDGYEPDVSIAWGRTMLRNYRPDHVAEKDYRWRYVMTVATDIVYSSKGPKNDRPELHYFQNIHTFFLINSYKV